MTFYVFLDLLVFMIPVALTLGILGGSYYFDSLDKVHRILLAYLMVSFLSDMASRICGKMFDNNLIFIPIVGFFELLFFSFIYYKFMLKTKFIWPVVVIALVFILVEACNIQVYNLTDFQTYSRVIASFLITLMSLAFYFEKIRDDTDVPANTLFLNSCILIAYALNLICFLPINFLINENSDLKFYFWLVNLVVTLTFYILLTFLIWKHGKNRKQLHYG